MPLPPGTPTFLSNLTEAQAALALGVLKDIRYLSEEPMPSLDMLIRVVSRQATNELLNAAYSLGIELEIDADAVQE